MCKKRRRHLEGNKELVVLRKNPSYNSTPMISENSVGDGGNTSCMHT